MKFHRSCIFWITVLLQTAGPLYFGFGNWCNVIQYSSGFGIPLAALAFYYHHKREINRLEAKLLHLHARHDELMKEVKRHG